MSKSSVKWSEGLRNRVSIIIGRYTDRMKFYCFFHILLVLLCITVYMVVCFVCLYLILYIYIFFLLRLYILIVMCVQFWAFCFIVLFCVLFVCKCVLYCNGVRRSSQPPTPLPRKGIRCHHFGYYYDVFHYIIYSTTVQHIT